MKPELLSLIIQISGLVCIALFTLLTNRKRLSIAFGIVLMLIVNVVAQIIIAGGGPGAFFGFIALPLLGYIVVLITYKLSNMKKTIK